MRKWEKERKVKKGKVRWEIYGKEKTTKIVGQKKVIVNMRKLRQEKMRKRKKESKGEI